MCCIWCWFLWLALSEYAEWKCLVDCSVPLGSVMLRSWSDLGRRQEATAKPPVAAAAALQLAGALQGPLGLQLGGAQTTPLGPLSSLALNRCASSYMSICHTLFIMHAPHLQTSLQPARSGHYLNSTSFLHGAMQRFMCFLMLKSSAILLCLGCTGFSEIYKNASSLMHLPQTNMRPAPLEPH